jgi:hypothetical protein
MSAGVQAGMRDAPLGVPAQRQAGDIVFDVAGYRVPVPLDDALWLRRRLGVPSGSLRFELSHALTELRHGRPGAPVELTTADIPALRVVLLPPPLAPLSEPLRHLRYAVTRRLGS